MNQSDWRGHAMDVALARYSVIAPLVSRPMTEEEKQRELRVIAAYSTHADRPFHGMPIADPRADHALYGKAITVARRVWGGC